MGGAVPSIRQPVRGSSQHSLFAVEQLSTFAIAKPNMLSLRRRNLPSHVLLERTQVVYAGAVPATPWAPLSSRSPSQQACGDVERIRMPSPVTALKYQNSLRPKARFSPERK